MYLRYIPVNSCELCIPNEKNLKKFQSREFATIPGIFPFPGLHVTYIKISKFTYEKNHAPFSKCTSLMFSKIPTQRSKCMQPDLSTRPGTAQSTRAMHHPWEASRLVKRVSRCTSRNRVKDLLRMPSIPREEMAVLLALEGGSKDSS